MPNFFYLDENGQKQGPVNDQHLKTLVSQGILTPETVLETEAGRKGKAGQLPVLFAATTAPTVQTTPTNSNLSRRFCTNCGNTVSEHAVACMSCGAKPTGHKKFCHSCGIHVNPFQVVCVKCGASLGVTRHGGASVGDNESSNIGAMWMHLTWLWCPLATLIIWSCIANKNPKANIHGKHILNAFFSAWIRAVLYGILVIAVIGAFGFFVVGPYIEEYDGSSESKLIALAAISIVGCILYACIVIIRPLVSSIIVAIAAGKGEVRPYKWAIRFFNT